MWPFQKPPHPNSFELQYTLFCYEKVKRIEGLEKGTGLEYKNLHEVLMRKYLAAAAMVLTGVLFQNFSFADLTPQKIQDVDERSRVIHAKELLGKYYRSSSVADSEGLQYINIHLFNQVQAHLPKNFKNKSAKITRAILSESEKFNFDPVFVLALIRTESNFNPLAIGSVGEIGLMQLRPETGEWIAKKEKIRWKGPKTLKDPVQNIRIGVAYLNFLRGYFDNKAYKYLSAYNVGPGKLKRLYEMSTPPKKYSITVMKHYEEFYSELAVYANLSNLASNGLDAHQLPRQAFE